MGIIKDAIKRECRKQGMSQVELAAMLGMKAGNLNNQIGRDDTVQFSLLKNICEKLVISVGSLRNEPSSDLQHSTGKEEFDMIYDQLKTILTEADDDVVEQIIGKIGREYMNLTSKKDDSLGREKMG